VKHATHTANLNRRAAGVYSLQEACCIVCANSGKNHAPQNKIKKVNTPKNPKQNEAAGCVGTLGFENIKTQLRELKFQKKVTTKKIVLAQKHKLLR
jgi:hypothetical protein